MDSRVHGRFFQVSTAQAGHPDFPEIISSQGAIEKVGDRERDLGDGVRVRLEQCGSHGDFLEGELCRVQLENIPPQTGPDGLSPIELGDGKGIGNVCAFTFHRPTRVLLLQRNVNSVTTSRLMLYLAAAQQGSFFSFAPVLSDDAMARFVSKSPRRFEVTFAGVDNLAAIEEAGIPAAHGARLIAEAYDGIRVKIQVSVGRTRKRFLEKEHLYETLNGLVDHEGVKSLKVTASGGGEDDIINFLREQMQGGDTLELPESDPSGNYTMRRNLLRKLFSDNISTLHTRFGTPNGPHH